MVKFKYFKNGLREVRCFVKRALMAKQSNDTADKARKKKKQSTVPRRSRSNSGVPSSASSAEGFIPLAARDSQWVGLDFYNPHFRSPLDEEDDVEEVELQNLAADGIEAIYLLFPGLAKNSNVLLNEHESSSTTEITKLLVGQKADFRNMRNSRRLILTDSKLKSVPEVLQEEKIQSETDISTCTTKKSVSDVESRAFCADDEDEEPEEDKRLKKRRKKSKLRMLTDGSSTSFIPTNSKIRQTTTIVENESSINETCESKDIKNKQISLLPTKDSQIKHK